jgi:hypothetical protein
LLVRTSEYLRCQAEACLRIARAAFDLTTAERLRLMAADLYAKAEEIAGRERHTPLDGVELHMMKGNGSGRNGSHGSLPE